MHAYVDSIASPAGLLAFAVDHRGALLTLAFSEGAYGQTMEEQLQRSGFILGADQQRTAEAREQLLEYANGVRQAFDIPLALTGTPWQNTVWAALTQIPYGETRTYGQVAMMVGRPGAARAVGRANATNRLPLVVPCHRVVGANGSLTGFAGGTHIKQRLLAHEARTRALDGLPVTTDDRRSHGAPAGAPRP